jgi:hypothetical protein
MSYASQNKRTINAAFKRFGILTEAIIENGMKRIMNEAMMIALATHDADHWFHKSTGNSYGWLVLHDGKHVAHKVNEGLHGEGDAYTELMGAARDVPQVGWVGILLASMGEVHDNAKGKLYFFHLDYEMAVLNNAREDVEKLFTRNFRTMYVAE